MLRARVAALPVDDHARGQHQPAREAGGGERAQQLRGGEIVVADVVGQVAEVDAEPDHRRLMADSARAAHGRGRHRGIAQVALEPLGRGVEIARALAVGGGQERVDAAHGVPACHERVDDVRTDESRCASDEDRAGHVIPS